jgi:drug/metabolite transporter (DMT)-like permease
VARYRLSLKPIDLLLLLMTIIWGSNFTVVKIAARYIPARPFNCLRLLIASSAFLAAIAIREGWPRLTRAEWIRVVQLAAVGHVIYQLCFLAAIERTTVANSALIFAFTPLTVALLTASLGHERIPVMRWVGAAISLAGIYLVVSAVSNSGSTALGNVLAVAAMVCWATYTVASRPLLDTRSPLVVTGYSMAIGSIVYVPISWDAMRSMAWSEVPLAAWAAVALSALLALFVAYMIWYTAVQTIGSTRTSMYSNVTPIAAMVTAAIWLGEPITLRKIAGTALVMAGLAASKLERHVLPPAET